MTIDGTEYNYIARAPAGPNYNRHEVDPAYTFLNYPTRVETVGESTSTALSLSVDDTTTSAGEEATLRFELTNTGDSPTTALGIQLTTLPEGFGVTVIDTQNGTASLNANAVFWTSPVAVGETVSATYTVAVPSDAPDGTYTISAGAQSDAGEVTTDASVSVGADGPLDPIDAIAGDDGVYQFREVLEAIEYFNDREVVPGTDGQKLTFLQMLEIIERFNNQR